MTTDTCADCGGPVEEDLLADRTAFEEAFGRPPRGGPRCKRCLLETVKRDVSEGD
jgi:hypothetical protein